MKRRRFTSKAEKAPANRLLPDHFQTALLMLPPDWTEKSFVIFCPIGEQQLPRYCGVFLHDNFRVAILFKCSNVKCSNVQVFLQMFLVHSLSNVTV